MQNFYESHSPFTTTDHRSPANGADKDEASQSGELARAVLLQSAALLPATRLGPFEGYSQGDLKATERDTRSGNANPYIGRRNMAPT